MTIKDAAHAPWTAYAGSGNKDKAEHRRYHGLYGRSDELNDNRTRTSFMIKRLLVSAFIFLGSQTAALETNTPFGSIDDGTLSIDQWLDQPVLIVNTASQGAFTKQYRGLQDLCDAYRDQGLIVLAVPSDDFNQEFATDAEVKDFCELQYGIDLPMTAITHVKGDDAHPFYASLKAEISFTPRWNFNKVFIDEECGVVAALGSDTPPQSTAITRLIDDMLIND
jgi:glutathione peroxidase